MTKKTYHNYNFNNIYSNLLISYADWFRYDLLPRIKEYHIGTFEKAVKHFKDRIDKSGEKHHPEYPFMCLEPGLGIDHEEKCGRFLYQFPNFASKIATDTYSPSLYEDDFVTISPILNRFVDTFSVIIWCSSVFEYLDMRMAILQMFGGKDRVIYPKTINGYFVLPDSLVYYTEKNPYTAINHELNWEGSRLRRHLIKNINKEQFIYPFAIRPYIKLTGISDGSEKYGGDDVSEYKLTVEIEWECHIPTHFILKTAYYEHPPWRMKFELIVDYRYFPDVHRPLPNEKLINLYRESNNIVLTEEFIDSLDIPDKYKILLKNAIGLVFENSTSFRKYLDENIMNLDVIKLLMSELLCKGIYKELIYEKHFNYELTVEDIKKIERNENLFISILEVVESEEFLLIYTKEKTLEAGYDFSIDKIEADKTIIKLIGFKIKENVKVDDIINFIIYEENEE